MLRVSLWLWLVWRCVPAFASPPPDGDEGALAQVPEPMVFDLVRGLHARRGELEVNTLVTMNPRRGRFPIGWAPEVEWAFADGYAIEFELPMVDRSVEAIKAAVQGRLPGSTPRFIHGWQLLTEHILDAETEISLLYLAGTTIGSRWSLFSMTGARVAVQEGVEHADVIVNPSVFARVHPQVVVGFESNLWVRPGREVLGEVLLMPQVHGRITDRFTLQVGAGATLTWAGEAYPTIGLRAIVE